MTENHTLGTILDVGYALELCCIKTEQIRRETVAAQKRSQYDAPLDALWEVVMKKVDEKYPKT